MTEPVVLAPKLDVAAASALLTTLRSRTDEELVIDMAEVKLLGALCLQVLLSAAKSANSDGRQISIINTTDRVLDQMRLMGMTPETIARGSA